MVFSAIGSLAGYHLSMFLGADEADAIGYALMGGIALVVAVTKRPSE
jgi:hypothetical protein